MSTEEGYKIVLKKQKQTDNQVQIKYYTTSNICQSMNTNKSSIATKKKQMLKRSQHPSRDNIIANLCGTLGTAQGRVDKTTE